MKSISITKRFHRPAFAVFCLSGWMLTASIFSGCADSEPGLGHGNRAGSKAGGKDRYLIRVGDSIATLRDFESAFEIAKVAYTRKAIQNSDAMQKVQLRLLNQLIEEMILLESARELHVKVSNAEVEKAAEVVKESFPENTFEQAFFENAIAYRSWKRRLKIRLIMEKVIEKEIEQRIVITPEDISCYYDQYIKGIGLKPSNDESNDASETIVNHLRRIKAEEAYNKWLNERQQKYTIDINEALWEKIAGSKHVSRPDAFVNE